MKRSIFAAVPALLLTAGPAFAHPGFGPMTGLAAGFHHPISGLDHVLAMTAVGILAAQMGGRALWLVPATFVTLMIAGGIAGVAGLGLPYVELGIAGSVVVLGFVISLGRRLPLAAAMAMVGVMGMLHGHAHGTEMPADVGGLEFGMGFTLATVLLHAIGIGLTLGAGKTMTRFAPLALRLGGGAIAAAGLVLLAS